MSAQVAVDAVTVLAWAAAAYKLPALLRSPRDPAKRYYWLALFLMALALTVLLPRTTVAIEHTLGRPNLARVLGDGLGLAAAWATQALLYHVNYPADQARRYVRRVGSAVTVAVLLMAGLFILGTSDTAAGDVTGGEQGAPFLAASRLVFLGALGVAIGNFARLSWRYGQRTHRPALRLGLRLVAVAGGIALGYVANEVLRVGAPLLGFADPIPRPGSVSQVLIATFMGLGLIGTTMPAWGPRVGIPALVAWLGSYRSLRRLYPLWLALYHAHPQIALLPPQSALAEALDVRNLHFRLYRRVVEMRDGQLYLRPAMDPADAARARQFCAAAQVPERDAAAVVEAALIATALRRQALGVTVASSASLPTPVGGADLPTEVAALERVARCARRSPIVRAVVAQSAIQVTTVASIGHRTE